MAESAPQAFNAQIPERKSTPPLPDKFVFPSHLPTPPFINVDGIGNFRDMGGYLTAASFFSGQQISNTKPTMVRRGLLYRCAHPGLLTPEGNKTLADELKIKHIFDLRSAPEVKKLSASVEATKHTDATTNPRSKALQPQGIERHFTPVYEEDDYGPVALATKLKWYTSAQSKSETVPYPYSEGFVNAYRDIATYATKSKSNDAAYPTILRQIIANPDEPIIFHCTAGKDRTGVLAAVLLRLAGVDDETIAYEYALTEPGLGSWRELFIERIARAGLGGAGTSSKEIKEAKPTMTREEAARIVGSRARNMRAWLRIVLDGEFGGVGKYLTEMCGLSAEEVEKLRSAIVVPVERAEDVIQMKQIPGWTPDGGVQDKKEDGDGGMPLNEHVGRETEQKVMAG